jgi:Predicted SAM-dependent RNA methyltransferase
MGMVDLIISYLGCVSFVPSRRDSLTHCLQGILGNAIFVCPIISVLIRMIHEGDDPPRDRTSELRVLGFPTRHLGPVQMTTDTALGVTKLVVKDGIPLSQIPYVVCPTILRSLELTALNVKYNQDFPTIRFNSKESVEMPFSE